MKKWVVVIGLILFTIPYCIGQDHDFCDAINAIMRDAPNKFRNIKGKTKMTNETGYVWDCGIKVPGTIASSFAATNGYGIFYNGALFQTRNKDELKPVYEKYRKKLDSCLIPMGLKLTETENFKPGLKDYKKLTYLPLLEGEADLAKMTRHVALEVDYTEHFGIYAIILCIYEH